jgi:quinoprotein glucose dehydrogenase
VPQGDIPGERYSPTQPFSTEMAPLNAPKLKETDIWGATPIDQLLCRIPFHHMRDDGLFTPPGLKPTIGWPAFDGVSDWYGATVDPEHKVMFINTTFMPFQLQMLPYRKALAKGLFKPWGGWSEPYPEPDFQNNPQHGTPYSIVVKPWLNAIGLPCTRPPWGQLQTIDLVTRKVLWQRPVGTTRDMRPAGLRMPLGLPTGTSAWAAVSPPAPGCCSWARPRISIFAPLMPRAERPRGRFICRRAATRPRSPIWAIASM